jgi:hypothetical protein
MEEREARTPLGGLRTWLIRLGLLASVVVLTLAIGEVATRWLVPEAVWRAHDDGADWRFDDQIGWVHRPHLDVSRMRDGRLVRFQTNEDGLTPPEARRERTPGVKRIMLFGDSSVLGRWVPQDLTIHVYLEGLLHSKGIEAEVFNAGVEGYSTDQALLLMERLIPLYRPDIVGYGLHPNDFGGIVSREAYGNAKPMLVWAQDGKLEVMPPVFHERRLQPLGPTHGVRNLVQHSALYRLTQPFVFRIRASLQGWEHELMHGIDQEAMYYRPEAMERIDWRLVGGLLGRMQRVSQEHGVEFFFYQHPDIGAVWDPYIEVFLESQGVEREQYDRFALEKKLSAVAASQGIKYCPVIAGFVAHPERGPFHLLPRDYHCNPAGYELTAELLAECLVAR